MNNYDYNTLLGIRAAMVELKTAAAAAGLAVAGWYDNGYDNFHISVYSLASDGRIDKNLFRPECYKAASSPQKIAECFEKCEAFIRDYNAQATEVLENKVGDLTAQLKQARAELRKAKKCAKTNEI